jgi:hypothetical protein
MFEIYNEHDCKEQHCPIDNYIFHISIELISSSSLLEVEGYLNWGGSPPTDQTNRLYVPGRCIFRVDGFALIRTLVALHG